MISHILLSIETTLLLSVAALYIVHCPFNKVEESFNTQAVHDIINILPDNLPTKDLYEESQQEVATRSQSPWDHMIFPGVVPRTFVGALIVGLPMKLAKYFMSKGFLSDNIGDESEPDLTAQFVLQIGSRFALSSFVVLSLSAITRAIHKRYGLLYRLCFLIATISQFHYIFYAGRLIPNTFAVILANLVFASWINRQYSKSVVYIAFCVVIFRFDTSMFFGWLLIDGVFIKKYIPLSRMLKVGIPAGFIAIVISFTIDSVLWARPVLPEFEGLYFNLWLNKSYQWGTQPYFWYIYNCLPRIMMGCAPFILLADHKITRDYLLPTLTFIFTYSLLPHKELRFILFVTPFLNICVASGLMNVHFYLNKLFLYLFRSNEKTRESYIAKCIFILFLMCVFIVNIFACLVLSRVSNQNYPGGQAAISLGTTKELLDSAQKSIDKNVGIRDPRSDVGVYVNNLAAQTGVSRFLQINGVYYAKTPTFDTNTFKKSYNLIYLMFEPKEVVDFLKRYCPLERNQEHLLERKGADKWRRSNNEIKCNLPNQSQMYCSIIESIYSYSSVSTWNQIRRLNLNQLIAGSLDSVGFIKTRVALHIIRCSTKSKFNPFS